MDTSTSNRWIFAILLFAVAALFLEYGVETSRAVRFAIHALDFTVLALFLVEYLMRLRAAPDRGRFLRQNLFDTGFLVVFTGLFLYSKYHAFRIAFGQVETLSTQLIFLRSIFVLLKIFGRIKKLNAFLRAFSRNPAQTMVLSFLLVILVGTILLLMPFATVGGARLGVLGALFTATSAVCVTGLIVVDTATYFTLTGQAIIMALIQCGGLGIMLFTFFTAYLLGRRLSLRERLEVSFLIDESDLHNLSRSVARIVTLTFLIEGAGFAALLPIFSERFGFGPHAIFFSAFHAVSAFCNAGFALFTDNLASFRTNVPMNLVIAALIVLGGISFAVLTNTYQHLRDRLRRRLRGTGRVAKLSLNTVVVLTVTGVLLAAGTLLLYGFEHGHEMLRDPLGAQYLEAFFQSVTLRTAGFNTIDFARLATPTLLVMILFMFIGGAAGSTAGGIKVNTVGVIYAYLKSLLHGRYSVLLRGAFLQKYVVSRALLVVLLGGLVVFGGTLILSITEAFPLQQILFEVTSAFGTVGLSTGITGELSPLGRIVITIIMFFGRLGPLTLITAVAMQEQQRVRYPEGHISVG